jgi:hypothetical protein
LYFTLDSPFETQTSIKTKKTRMNILEFINCMSLSGEFSYSTYK